VLLCLGVFQLAEHLICTAYAPLWIKIGYVAITLLPPLGIHIISEITKRYTKLLVIAYSIATFLIALILFLPQLELRAVCQPHFVEVFNSDWFGWVHFSYYAVFVFAAMYLLWHSIHIHRGDKKEEIWMLVAYIGFVVPALGLFYLKIISHVALPSVMCGFAVIVALILTLVVIPRYYTHVRTQQKGKKRN
jgi:hypothetical protein